MDVSVAWNGKMSFTGIAESGFSVDMDSDESTGGENSGFRPLELMALSLAGCTAMDVISILKKKKQDVTDFKVHVHASQQDEHPHVFTYIMIEYVISGKDIDPKAVERSIELSTTRYCPANAMLAKAVQIDTRYDIFEAVSGGAAD